MPSRRDDAPACIRRLMRARPIGSLAVEGIRRLDTYPAVMQAARVTDRIGSHLEGPVWWPRLGRFRLVDMLAGDVLTLDGHGGVERHPTGSSIAACLRPRRTGGAIIARERDVVVTNDDTLDDVGASARVIATVVDEALEGDVRVNEGGCDPSGAFYVGTMAYDQRDDGGRLARIVPTPAVPHEITTAVSPVSVSNGIAWSPRADRAYYCDSGSRTVSVFAWSPDGGLGDRLPFVSANELEGAPDGCVIDAEGGLWVALNGAGRVHRYTADGALSAVVDVDARQVTACTFGGDGLRTLLITTSREGLDDGDDAQAGSLFAVEPGVAGLEPLAYAA